MSQNSRAAPSDRSRTTRTHTTAPQSHRTPEPLLALLPIVASLYLVWPHLTHALWQDEAKTLALYASQGVAHPFTDYRIPNNHVIFSAALHLWRGVAGDSVVWLRALPLACFAASLVLLAFAARRIGGRHAAVFACALFATSHVTLNFAVELRGYGVSWLPVTAGLWLLAEFLETGRARFGAGYAAALAVAVGILPTNALAAGVLGGWAWGVSLSAPVRPPGRALARLALVTAAPLAGFLTYAAVWEQLLAHAGRAYPGEPPWPPARMLAHWLWATSIDFWALAPLALFGGWRLLAGARRDARLWLAASCAAVPTVALLALPSVPHVRTLVPLLPLWYAWVGAVLAAGWRPLADGRPVAGRAALLVLLAGTVALAAAREADQAGYAARHPEPSFPLDLYDQVYHHRYDPAGTVALLRQLGASAPALVVTDFFGLWGLSPVIERQREAGAAPRLVHFRRVDLEARRAAARAPGPIVLVTTSLEKANEMLAHHGLPALRDGDRIASTGIFKIYPVP